MATRTIASFLALAATAWACSVLNAFDDVAAPSDASAGGSAGSGGTAGSTGGVAGTAGGSGGAVGGAAGGGGIVDGGNDPGLIVVAGTVPPDGGSAFTVPALSVLSPQTGEELLREVGVEYSAVLYEPDTQLWFLLENAPHEGGTATRICARKFQRPTAQWVAQGDCATGLPLVGAAVVLPKRIVYLDDTFSQLVLVDTANPGAIVLQSKQPAPANLLGLVGHIRNGLTVGGEITYIVRECAGTACTAKGEVWGVSAGGASKTSGPTDLGNYVGTFSPGWTGSTDPATPALVTAFAPTPAEGGTTCGSPCEAPVTRRGVSNLTNVLNSTTFVINPPSVQRVAPLAYDPCFNTAFIGFTAFTGVYVVPLAAGGTTSFATSSQSVQALTFEPFTRTLILPYGQGAVALLQAWYVGGTPNAPTLAPRGSDWKPPKDLKPGPLAVAIPSSSPSLPDCKP